MSDNWTIITDGTPVSRALASWLLRHRAGTLIEVKGKLAAAAVATALRRTARMPQVILIDEAASSKATAGVPEARRAAAIWLQSLSAHNLETSGAEVLEQRVRRGAPGSQALRDLLLTGGPAPRELAKNGDDRATSGRPRGRPAGLNPFHGSGFDVCSLLLLDPTRVWTARGIAGEIDRALSLVQRALAELERRSLLRRLPRGVQAVGPQRLRDELLQGWTVHVGSPRTRATSFIAPRRKGVADAVFASARRAKARCLLAGPSAVQGRRAVVGEPLTIYADADPLRVFAADGFAPAWGTRGDFVVWSPPERTVFLQPRVVAGRAATNRLITFLDLAATGSERHRAAAEAAWEGDG